MTILDDDKYISIICRIVVVFMIWLSVAFLFSFQDKIRNFDKDELIRIEATYQSYKEKKAMKSPHATIYLVIYFSDLEKKYVEAEIYNTNVLEKIRRITPGTKVKMCVTPDTDAILEMEVKGEIILDYEDSLKKRHKEVIFTLVFIVGIICIGLLLLFEMKKLQSKKPRYVRYSK